MCVLSSSYKLYFWGGAGGGGCDRGSSLPLFSNNVLTLGFIQKHSVSDSISFIISVRGKAIGLGKLNCRRLAQANQPKPACHLTPSHRGGRVIIRSFNTHQPVLTLLHLQCAQCEPHYHSEAWAKYKPHVHACAHTYIACKVQTVFTKNTSMYLC